MSQFELGSAFDDAGNRRYRNIGFDLDDTCTGEGQGSSCAEPPWANANDDGRDGIDNAFGEYSAGMAALDTVVIQPGPNFFVLRVRGYSGQPNDDQVEVSWYASLGSSADNDGGDGGLDRLTIDPEVLVPPTDGGAPSVESPRFVDPRAYVSGGVLVAHFDEARWNNSNLVPTLLIPVHYVVLQASLKQVDSETWELDDGVVGWRVALKWFLFSSAFNNAAFPPATDPFCKYPAYQAGFIIDQCQRADISYDGGSPQTPCDAMSVGLGFQAKQASLGDVGDPPPPAPLSWCDQTVHPGNQSCASPTNY